MRVNKQTQTDAVPTYSGREINKSQRFMGRVFRLTHTPTSCEQHLVGNVYMIASSCFGLVGINLQSGRWCELMAGDKYQEHFATVEIGEAK